MGNSIAISEVQWPEYSSAVNDYINRYTRQHANDIGLSVTADHLFSRDMPVLQAISKLPIEWQGCLLTESYGYPMPSKKSFHTSAYDSSLAVLKSWHERDLFDELTKLAKEDPELDFSKLKRGQQVGVVIPYQDLTRQPIFV